MEKWAKKTIRRPKAAARVGLGWAIKVVGQVVLALGRKENSGKAVTVPRKSCRRTNADTKTAHVASI